MYTIRKLKFDMKKLFLILALLLIPAGVADATTRYVAPSGSGNTCSDNTPCSLTQGLSVTAAGDTLNLKAGVYAPTATLTDPLPSGLSASHYTIIQAAPGEIAEIRPTSAVTNVILLGAARRWIAVKNLILNCQNRTSGSDCQGFRIATTAAIQDLLFEGNTVKNCRNNCIVFGDATLRPVVRGNKIGPTTFTVASTLHYNRASSGLIEYNDYFGGGSCITNFSADGAGQGTIIRHNRCHDLMSRDTGSRGINITSSISQAANAIQVYNNSFYNIQHRGIHVGSSFTKIYNNTFWNVSGVNVDVRSGANNVSVLNNIMIGGGTAIENSGSGTTLLTNLTSGTVSNLFIDHAKGNFCLKSTATSAINQATPISGLAFNARDIGACEYNGTTTIPPSPTTPTSLQAVPIGTTVASSPPITSPSPTTPTSLQAVPK